MHQRHAREALRKVHWNAGVSNHDHQSTTWNLHWFGQWTKCAERLYDVHCRSALPPFGASPDAGVGFFAPLCLHVEAKVTSHSREGWLHSLAKPHAQVSSRKPDLQFGRHKQQRERCARSLPQSAGMSCADRVQRFKPPFLLNG